MKKITVQWIGHACYKLTFGDWSCVVDPYENGSVPGLGDVQAAAHEVYCSHGHHDHNAAHLVKQVRMFAPAPEITKVASFHDDAQGTKRGQNTIHVFEYQGMKLAHFGDLGHVLTEEQVQQAGDVDVVLIPVGGFYTIDPQTAKKVAQQVNAKIIIPMHYRTEQFGFDVIAHIDEFTQLFDNVIVAEGSTAHITIGMMQQPQVLVLTPAALEKQI
ncbi:MAG: MBL fold metallo-hydrolase [Oscillospiraceae bacterium]|nr:MBL fold metallo-hydrolase [Oscillospiraceae bacterium]